jgi:DNA topoisomerase-2
VNPAFDSQTKDTLATKPFNFGSECILSQKFINKIINSGILDSIVTMAKAKEKAMMHQNLRGHKRTRLLGIPKLEDANWAGTRNADKCTLILTEGDSAKALTMSGISIVGRDKFGVFPLKGKLLNVRDASNKQLAGNVEI